MAEVTLPLPSVLRSDEVMPVIARFVVVPFVSENLPPVMRPLLSMVKSEEGAKALFDEEILKSVGPLKVLEAAKSESLANGVEVPMPTLLLPAMTKEVCVLEPTTNWGTPAARLLGFTERRPHGVEEPMTRKPAEVNVDVAVPPKYAPWNAEN